MTSSRKVRAKLREAGISQGELSRRCGIETSNMSFICSHDRNVTEKTLWKMCQGLGCKPEEIMKDWGEDG